MLTDATLKAFIVISLVFISKGLLDRWNPPDFLEMTNVHPHSVISNLSKWVKGVSNASKTVAGVWREAMAAVFQRLAALG